MENDLDLVRAGNGLYSIIGGKRNKNYTLESSRNERWSRRSIDLNVLGFLAPKRAFGGQSRGPNCTQQLVGWLVDQNACTKASSKLFSSASSNAIYQCIVPLLLPRSGKKGPNTPLVRWATECRNVLLGDLRRRPPKRAFPVKSKKKPMSGGNQGRRRLVFFPLASSPTHCITHSAASLSIAFSAAF